jgi:hypothetical protein
MLIRLLGTPAKGGREIGKEDKGGTKIIEWKRTMNVRNKDDIIPEAE